MEQNKQTNGAGAAGRGPLEGEFDRVKQKHPGALVLMKSGDLYQTFGADARTASELLGSELLKNGQAERTAFQQDELKGYRDKIEGAGMRIVVCDTRERSIRALAAPEREAGGEVAPAREPDRDNLDYLCKQAKFLGFGDDLGPALEKAIGGGGDTFTLNKRTVFSSPSGRETAFKLHFGKGKNGRYYLNSYTASLLGEGEGAPRSQTFRTGKAGGTTAKEAFNLLEGRAVLSSLKLRNGGRAEAWVEMDFGKRSANGNYCTNAYFEGYGFDLKSTLAGYPIQGLGVAENMARAVKSMEKGNLHRVSFISNGAPAQGFVRANPRYKNLSLYYADMSPVHSKSLEASAFRAPRASDPDANPLFNSEGNDFTEALLDDMENGLGIGRKELSPPGAGAGKPGTAENPETAQAKEAGAKKKALMPWEAADNGPKPERIRARR